jgi:hypothetical protein
MIFQILKLSNLEKATKFEKNLPLVLTFTQYLASKQVEFTTNLPSMINRLK